MSTDEPRIIPHHELQVEPAPVIPAETIEAAPAESWRRGREFHVFKVPSRSTPLLRTVVYNEKLRVVYCDCDAARYHNVCDHIRSVLWKMAYQAAYRMYACLTLQELREREFDFIEMERGALVQVRCWRAINSAIGELVRQRTDEAA